MPLAQKPAIGATKAASGTLNAATARVAANASMVGNTTTPATRLASTAYGPTPGSITMSSGVTAACAAIGIDSTRARLGVTTPAAMAAIRGDQSTIEATASTDMAKPSERASHGSTISNTVTPTSSAAH